MAMFTGLFRLNTNIKKMQEQKDVNGLMRILASRKKKVSAIRGEAALALGKLGDPRALEPILQALKDDEYHLRISAARALGELKDTRAVEPLVQALKDKESHVRANSAYALGELKDTRAVEPLVQALKDASSHVRQCAVYGLKFIEATSALEHFLQALKDEDKFVRMAAVSALGTVKDARALDALIYASKDTEKDVRIQIIDELHRIGNAKALQALLLMINDKDHDVSNKVLLKFLENAESTVGLDYLIQSLNDEFPEIKKAAVIAICKCLYEGSWRIREASAKALGNFGSDVAVPALLKALKERRFFSDATIAEMRRPKDSLSNDLMISALAVQEGKVQIAIVEALERIAPKRSQQVLDDLATLKEALNIYTNIKQLRPSGNSFTESVDKVEKELTAAVDKAVQTLSNLAKASASDVVDRTTHIPAYNSKAAPVLAAEAISEIRSLAQDRIIEAIKRVRELTGLGLKEAKDYVEALAPDQRKPSDFRSDTTPLFSFEEEAALKNLLAQGQKIEAIKRVRKLKDCGLKEAQDYLDMLKTGDSRAVNDTIVAKGQGSRGITDCYRCRRSVGDGSLSNTISIFQSGSFSGMTYNCKSCGRKYCLDCMSILKKGDGVCDACGGKLGW